SGGAGVGRAGGFFRVVGGEPWRGGFVGPAVVEAVQGHVGDRREQVGERQRPVDPQGVALQPPPDRVERLVARRARRGGGGAVSGGGRGHTSSSVPARRMYRKTSTRMAAISTNEREAAVG